MRVELTSNADDNEDAPVFPILLLIECEAGINGGSVIECLINARFNTVRDELTFNADDKTHTSESPMSVFRKKREKRNLRELTIYKHSFST